MGRDFNWEKENHGKWNSVLDLSHSILIGLSLCCVWLIMVIDLSGVRIWFEIIRVFFKSDERAARVRFEITSMISDQNFMTRSLSTTLLQPLWNCRIQFISVPNLYWSSRQFAEKWKQEVFLHLILYPKQQWCDVEQKWCNLKQKWCDLEQMW